EFLVPREREPHPLGIQPRVVEGINNDDDQRGIQKGVSQDGRNPQPAQSPVHSRDLRATQAAKPASTTAMTVSTIDSTLPNGQSRVSRNCCLITLPIMIPSVPPRMSGIANMPSAGMNTSAAPAYTPGSDSGKVTRQNRSQAFAPRSCAASSSAGSCFSRLAYSGSTMNGRCTYTRPTITANGVNNRDTGSKPKKPMKAFSARTNTDCGPRM